MNAPCRDVSTILDGVSSLGLTEATDLFYSRMPDAPDNCVSISDGPGSQPQLTLKKETSDYYFPTVTIYVRNVDFDDAYTVINSIIEYLHGLSDVTVGSTLYTLFKAFSDPQLLRWDESDRAILMVNFEVQRRNV